VSQHQLSAALDKAFLALQQHPLRHLPYLARKDVAIALGGDECEANSPLIRLGWRRRVHLSSSCVRRALAHTPETPFHDAAYQLLEQVGQTANDHDTLYALIGEYSAQSDEMSLQGLFQQSLLASAVAKLISAALYDQDWIDEADIDSVTGEPVDSYDWDVALFVCGVCSNGFPWNSDSDRSLREEYWKWYLGEGALAASLIT
jgi:hypothetical protein